MGTPNPIKQHIAGLRGEVERQRTRRLAAIDKLESDLLGLDTGERSPLSADGADAPSNVDRVIAILSEVEFKAAKEVAAETGLSESQARGALYARSMKDRVEKRKSTKGHPARFRLKPQKEPSSPVGGEFAQMTQSQAAKMVLRENKDPLPTQAIVDEMIRRGFVSADHKRLKASLFTMMTRNTSFEKVSPGVWAITESSDAD